MTRSILSLLAAAGIDTPETPTPIFVVHDNLKDLDDTVANLGEAGLHYAGVVKIVGGLGVLNPSTSRAQALKGTFVELGLSEIPVGAGSDITEQEKAFGYETCGYMAPTDALVDGTALLKQVLEASDGNLVLVVSAGLTDLAEAIDNDPDIFADAVAEVVIMGGVNVTENDGTYEVAIDEDGYMTPDTAANNAFDQAAAEKVYRFCQEEGVQLTILTREAAYACQVTLGEFYSRLEATGSPIGKHLLEAQAPGLEILFARCCEPEGTDLRGKLPMRCNRPWFVDTFCLGEDPGEIDENGIWPHVKAGQAYDLMAALAVPGVREAFYSPVEVEVNGMIHRVIGLNRNQNNGDIADVNALREFMHELCIATVKTYGQNNVTVEPVSIDDAPATSVA